MRRSEVCTYGQRTKGPSGGKIPKSISVVSHCQWSGALQLSLFKWDGRPHLIVFSRDGSPFALAVHGNVLDGREGLVGSCRVLREKGSLRRFGWISEVRIEERRSYGMLCTARTRTHHSRFCRAVLFSLCTPTFDPILTPSYSCCLIPPARPDDGEPSAGAAAKARRGRDELEGEGGCR